MMRATSIEFFLAAWVVQAGPAFAAERLGTVTVKAGQHRRLDVPISAVLDGIPTGVTEVTLLEADGKQAPCQLDPGSPPRLWWILSGPMESGAEKSYEVLAGAQAPAESVELKDDGAGLDISSKGLRILHYNYAATQAPAKVDAKYVRGGTIHPLLTPSGLMITDDFPPDHLHHKGLWAAWTSTEFEGRKPDFWNLGTLTGTVRFKSMDATWSGPVFAGFQAEHEYVDLSAPEPKVALLETWTVRVWKVGGPDEKVWLFDLDSSQRCASESPLKLPQYRYGGIGLRGAREWAGQNCQFLTSEGKTRLDGHGTTAKWCDMSGTLGGQIAGALIMGHPQNFRFPEPMRIHPTEPFFNFVPIQSGDWVLEPGKDYVFRYRYCVHDGTMTPERAAQFWADYGEPPQVTFSK